MSNLTIPTPDWSCGITDRTIYNGVLFRTGLYNELKQKDFIFADVDLKYNADATSIKNYLKFDAMIYTSDYSSPVISDSSTLTRQKIKATGSDTYNLGKCLDIKYVARYLSSNIIEVINTSSFKIDSDSTEAITNYDSRLFENNLGGKLVCNIIDSTGNHNIRVFTISGDTITLESPISSLSINNTFELISSLDILKEGLEQTTGYPDKGYCIKSIKPDSDSYIKFGKFDVPPLLTNSYVIIYYNQIAPYKPEHYFLESIKRNGLFLSNEKIDFPITKEQFDILLSEYKKYIESKKEYILTTYRPNEAQVGWKIPVNIPYFPNGVYTITDVEIESVKLSGQLKDKHLIKQVVKLSNYFDNLASLLASFKNTSRLSQSRIEENKNNTSFINFRMISIPTLHNVEPPTFIGYTFINVNSEPTDNYLTINWNPSPNAVNYYIQISLTSDFTDIKTEGLTGNSIEISTYDAYTINNTQFYARLKVKTNDGFSDWSDTLEIEKIIQKNYVTDANTLLYYRFQENTGTNINDETTNNRDSTITGTTSWQSGIILGDTSSLYFNGNSNTATSNFNPAVTDFTARISFRFNTNDKASKSTHILVSRYDTLTGISTVNGADIICEFDPTINKFLFTVYQSNTLYRTFEASYTALENTDYSVQFAFKLNHLGSNLFEICVNGIKLTTSLNFQNITNISSIQNSNIPLMIGAYRSAIGTYYRGQFRTSRVAFDNRFRSESEALIDYNNLKTTNTDFIMPSGKIASILYNKVSMIGTGTIINDLANDNDATLSNNTSWVTDSVYGNGINIENTVPTISHNNNLKSSGTSAKFLVAYIFEITEIINNSVQGFYATQNSPNTETNLGMETNSIGQTRFFIHLHDNTQTSQPSILGIRTNWLNVSINQKIKLGFYIDLSNNDIQIIENQTNYTTEIIPNSESIYFFNDINSFKASGGLINTGQHININNKNDFGTHNPNIKLWRMLIAKDSNTPTPTELKTMFANIG